MNHVDSGDTTWVLVSTALVLLMTPGLALFYAGMVRSKNALGMIMQNFVAIGVVTVTWALVGYSLAFDSDAGGGLVGGLHLAGLTDAAQEVPGLPDLTIPPMAFMVFQLMFAVITAALIAGGSADRMRFGGFVTFITVWSVIVYAPLAHWTFSPGGWLNRFGVLDLAGGTVVEICSGASALALVLVVGRRRGWPKEIMAPHNLPLTMLGAGLLWFGWLGFNAGSVLSAGPLAAQAVVNTHFAGVGGMLGWLLLEKRLIGHATTLGAVSGAVAGLVAATPAAGFIDSLPALLLGVIAGMVGLLAVRAKFRLGYDDSLDVLGVHFIGGVIGTLFIGFFASQAVNAAISDEGLLLGGGLTQLGRQAVGVLAAGVWSFVVSYLIAWVLNKVRPLRVSPEDELTGLDFTQHAETAYDLGSAPGMGRLG
ncbi:MAG: ammonium transporter [Kineosporiaceae bacterium]